MTLLLAADGFAPLDLAPPPDDAREARLAQLRTAVLLSLLCDARAAADDALPDPREQDRRGWWADTAGGPGTARADAFGSRLWLLAREKSTEATRQRAEAMARDALAWMVADGVAARVEVAAAWARDASGAFDGPRQRLEIRVGITLPGEAAPLPAIVANP